MVENQEERTMKKKKIRKKEKLEKIEEEKPQGFFAKLKKIWFKD